MPSKLSAEEALITILAGNERWARSESSYPNHGIDRSEDCLHNGQHPFAVVLGCSDSRKPIELIMDVGLGDIFVVREAGYVICDCTLASIEYGVLALGAPLIMVIGHQNCGAVNAAVDNLKDGQIYPGHINSIIEKIKPAAEAAQHRCGEVVENTTKLHIKRTVGQLMASQPILSQRAKEGRLRVVGAYYSLQTRRLNLMAQPSLAEAVAA